MAGFGIFPKWGWTPGTDNEGVTLSFTPRSGCEAVYYNEVCPQRVDARASNALISEIVEVLNAANAADETFGYDCRRRDNLAGAINTLVCQGAVGFQSHAPTDPDPCAPCDPVTYQPCPSIIVQTGADVLWLKFSDQQGNAQFVSRKLVPIPPDSGAFVLRSVDGVLSWVADNS